MAALANEPWRGAAASEVAVTLATANNHRAWVSFDVNAAMPAGDQATWEGAAGASLTLRFRWQSNGSGSGQQAPTFATVRAMLPGGAQIGTDWSVAFPAVDTEVTRTFHFDDDPMNAALGAIRAGAVELYLVWGSTGGVTPWSADSRGVTTGTILPTNTVNNARGYARASVAVPSVASISNVALGGSNQQPNAALDSLFIRIAFSAVTYRSIAPTISLRRPSNGAAERQSSVASGTAVNREVSWTSTTAGLTAVIGAGMALAVENKDIRIDIAALDFGGDNEYVFAASGHNASWTRDTELSLRLANWLQADPRIYPSSGDLADHTADRGALFHNQNGGAEFFDPPSSGDIENGQRVFPDVGFVGVRLLNARGEGLNGLTATIKMWDAASIGSSEGSPAHTLSRVTETRRIGAPATVPEAGWLPQEQTGVNRDKLPLTWSTVFAGTWRVKSVVTAPSALVGIENYPLVSGGASWNRNVFLITSNPNYSAPIISQHPHNIANHGTHLTRNDELVLFVYMIDNNTHKFVQLVEDNGDGVEVELTREHHPTGRCDYFDFATQTWVEKANGAAIADSDTLIRASDSPAHPGGDPDAWTNYPIYAGDVFLPDPGGELDFTVVATMTKDGVPYSQSASVSFVGENNRHNRNPTFISIDGPLEVFPGQTVTYLVRAMRPTTTGVLQFIALESPTVVVAEVSKQDGYERIIYSAPLEGPITPDPAGGGGDVFVTNPGGVYFTFEVTFLTAAQEHEQGGVAVGNYAIRIAGTVDGEEFVATQIVDVVRV